MEEIRELPTQTIADFVVDGETRNLEFLGIS